MFNYSKLIFRECLKKIIYELIPTKSSFHEVIISTKKKTNSSLKYYVFLTFQK